jgi:serine/threonine protein phosphatase PrpC
MVKTRLRFSGASDMGRVRRNNEDAFHIDGDRGIFLVVDGIGGQAAGEKAAEIAVERVRARLERQTGTAEERIREAIAMANNEIVRAAGSNPQWQGMACVLTLALVESDSAVIGHVGDSRLYKIRGGEIRKITHDHSPVGEREDNQELSEAEAMRHPRRNEVFRDVGSEEHRPDDAGFIEVQRIPFEPDAALLLCSDGLSDLVGSLEIRRTVEANAGNPHQAVAELIQAANRAGGKDNVTVLVVEGDQFTKPAVPEPEQRFSGLFAGRGAMMIYGLVGALAIAWLARGYWTPPPLVIAPRTLVVRQGGAYSTIAKAMAEARPGDTVLVRIGEYREQVRLKSGVTLKSMVPREAILRAAPMSGGPAIVADDVRDARVSGFWIDANPPLPLSAGILLNNSPVEIDDTEISGAVTGVEVRGAASPALIGNAIHDCGGEGILISGPSSPWLSHNSILRNRGAGIAARDGARPSLVGNVIEGNSLELLPGTDLDGVRAKNFLLEPKAEPIHGKGTRGKGK